MNKENQRIAIAEACGWSKVAWSHSGTGSYLFGYPPGITNNDEHSMEFGPLRMTLGTKAKTHVPDYLNDLNAINQEEQTLLYDQRKIYAEKISFMLRDQSIAESFYELMYLNMIATADQRAEAFLKTIGKWEEDGQVEDVSRQHGLDEDSEREKDN